VKSCPGSGAMLAFSDRHREPARSARRVSSLYARIEIMTILVIAEHDNASIKSATLSAVTAAMSLPGPLHLLVAGCHAEAAVREAAAIRGVDTVLHADGEPFAHGLAENVAAQVLALAKGYSHILFAATAYGKSIGPRVAAELDVAQVSEIIAVLNEDTFQRPIYAGNAIATVRSVDPIKVLTVRVSAFEPAGTEGEAAVVESIQAVADSDTSRFVGEEPARSDRPELKAARVIVSGGRALGSSEKFNEVLAPLADKLSAALGASRAAVDSGYAPNDWQVGQTGKIVAPQLYIACGISGAIQHLAGMKDSKVIVAINKDPEAPIFSVADYSLVGDLFELVPALVDSL
jgi:electron transfer flavoprotein alpha subunit